MGLTALPPDERIKVTLERMERVFPGARSNFEKGVTKCWSEDEWVRGAWAHSDEKTLQVISKPEGRVHFAGDHTSLQASWMQGALESGVRVVREINKAAQRRDCTRRAISLHFILDVGCARANRGVGLLILSKSLCE